jgi:hypothetical protein
MYAARRVEPVATTGVGADTAVASHYLCSADRQRLACSHRLTATQLHSTRSRIHLTSRRPEHQMLQQVP